MKIRNYPAGLLAFIFALSLASCQKDDQNSLSQPGVSAEKLASENGNNPDDVILTDSESSRFSLTGYVYTMNNQASQNEILCYKQHPDGSLTFESATASGGAGTGGGLGSQGALILDKQNNWLYAVNAGSNSVSSFMVHSNGSLTLMHTVPSGGMMPISVTTYRNFLYVLNAGSDMIKGFSTGAGGTMTAIPGSEQMLSGMGAGGAQVAFSPNGRYLYVTEKATNMISAYLVNGMGVAQPGNASSSVGQTPFGFEFARNNFMLVSNAAGGMAGAGSTTSYTGVNTGNISAVNGAVPSNQAAPCWVAVSEHGRYAYVTNTATDNISSYYVSPTGSIYLLNPAIASGDGPIDMVVSGNNLYAYTLCAADHTIRGYSRTPLGGLSSNNTVSGLPAGTAGLAAF